jgi:hypothetical protein
MEFENLNTFYCPLNSIAVVSLNTKVVELIETNTLVQIPSPYLFWFKRYTTNRKIIVSRRERGAGGIGNEPLGQPAPEQPDAAVQPAPGRGRLVGLDQRPDGGVVVQCKNKKSSV